MKKHLKILLIKWIKKIMTMNNKIKMKGKKEMYMESKEMFQKK